MQRVAGTEEDGRGHTARDPVGYSLPPGAAFLAMTRRLLALLLALLVTPGCDSEGSLLGEFEGRTAIGAQTRDVEGEAVYTVVETDRGPEFVIGLFVGDLFESDVDAYDYVLFRRTGDRPGVGAYVVDEDPISAVAATIARVDEADDPLDSFGAVLAGTDGTLAITRVDGYGNVAGSYRFSAEGLRVDVPGDRVTGSASGTFEARYERPETFRRLGLDLGL